MLLVLLLAPAMSAQPAARHPITLDDADKLLQPSRPEIAPDGSWIAYTLRRTDTEADKLVSQLWMVSWDGSQDVQLTYDEEGASAPRWSPNGRYLAFRSSRPSKARSSQLWVLDRRGGEARQLTGVKQELRDYRWSPDSRQLLLKLREKDEPANEKQDRKPVPPSPSCSIATTSSRMLKAT